MLNRLLEYNYSAVGIFLFIALLKLLLFFSGQIDSGDYSQSLFAIFRHHNLVGALLSALITVLLGVFILTNSERHAKRTDFSFWLVLIFSLQMSFYGYFAITEEYIGLFFFLISLYFFSKGIAYIEKSKAIIDCFNLAFFLGIGTLFTPHLIYTLPLFWSCRLFLSLASFRGLIASILGFILPFIIIDTLIFVFYEHTAEYAHLFIINALSDGNFISPLRFNAWEQLALVGPFLFLIFSLYTTFTKAYKMKTVVRKFNAINLYILIYIGITIILGIIPVHYGMMLFFVPSSYFFSNFQASVSSQWQYALLGVLLVSLAFSFPPVVRGIISLYEMMF